MRKSVLFLLMGYFFVWGVARSCADMILLHNGDQISGKLIEQEKHVVIESPILGRLLIQNDHIKEIVRDKGVSKPVVAEPESKIPPWKREVTVGYNITTGNTKTEQLNAGARIYRKTDLEEWSLKGDGFYSSSNSKMDVQKYTVKGYYGVKFWGGAWYNFLQTELLHDRFAEIDYQLVPLLGTGYWFREREHDKLKLEIGVGLDYVNYRDTTKTQTEPIVMTKVFYEKEIFTNSIFTQEVAFYPQLEDPFNAYRVRSETAVSTPIKENLSLRLSLIDNYNSMPAATAKKNDVQVVTNLVYVF